MWNAGLDEAQAGIKIAGRNINNLRYADDTTLIAESEQELESLLMKMEDESEKVGPKLHIQRVENGRQEWKSWPKTPQTLWDSVGEGAEIWENGIETCII